METKKPRKPKKIYYKSYTWKDGVELISVDEHIHASPDSDGIEADRSVSFWGEYDVFQGLTNDEQAKLSMQLSQWFFRYSRWIKTRPQGKV